MLIIDNVSKCPCCGSANLLLVNVVDRGASLLESIECQRCGRRFVRVVV